jgi:hypothetical protein
MATLLDLQRSQVNASTTKHNLIQVYVGISSHVRKVVGYPIGGDCESAVAN